MAAVLLPGGNLVSNKYVIGVEQHVIQDSVSVIAICDVRQHCMQT